jgi:hypothetical protein
VQRAVDIDWSAFIFCSPLDGLPRAEHQNSSDQREAVAALAGLISHGIPQAFVVQAAFQES